MNKNQTINPEWIRCINCNHDHEYTIEDHKSNKNLAIVTILFHCNKCRCINFKNNLDFKHNKPLIMKR